MILSEEWNKLNQKSWVKNYQALYRSDFMWKALQVCSSSYLMSCGDKTLIPLIGLTGYISYSPSLVAGKFRGIQYMLKTQGLAKYNSLFKDVNHTMRCVWGQLVLFYGEEQQKESSTNPNHLVWRNDELYEVLRNIRMQSQISVRKILHHKTQEKKGK